MRVIDKYDEGGVKLNENIKSFVNYIQDNYEDLKLNIEYISSIEEYNISHSNSNYTVNNIEFTKFLNNAIQVYLLDKQFYNFTFGYDGEID